MCNWCFVVMADFMAGNEDMNLSFMSFAQSVSLDKLPDDAAVDLEIERFTSQLGRFPQYTQTTKRLTPYFEANRRISFFISQLNEFKIKIQNMRGSPIHQNAQYIADFSKYLQSLRLYFTELQGNLAVYFQNAASAQDGRGKSIKENLKDLLLRMTTIVDSLQP